MELRKCRSHLAQPGERLFHNRTRGETECMLMPKGWKNGSGQISSLPCSCSETGWEEERGRRAVFLRCPTVEKENVGHLGD